MLGEGVVCVVSTDVSTDRHRYEVAPWGSLVVASAVNEDGWINVGDLFLPSQLQGSAYLST